MDIFGWLFGRSAPKRADLRTGAKVTVEARTVGSASVFATAGAIVGEAFDQVMAEVDAPAEAKRRLRPLFVEAHRSGDPRKEVEAIETVLNGVEWGEGYFGTLRARFEAEGAFPHIWESRAKALRTDPPPPPSTIGEALRLLRVTDMRDLLVALAAMPDKGRPKKRAEFIDLLSATGATREIVEAAQPRHEAAIENYLASRAAAKSEILAHTLTMQAYALRDRHNSHQLRGR